MKISPERLDELIAEYDYRSSAFPYHVETESALRNFREARKLLAEARDLILEVRGRFIMTNESAVRIGSILSRIKAITP